MDEPVTSELELMLSALTLPRASLLPRLSQELERGRHLLQPEVLESSEILGDDTPDVDVHLVRVAAGLGVRLARLPELRWRPDDQLERPDPETRRRLSSLGAALRRREAVLGGLARALVARAAPALSDPDHQLPRWPLTAWCEAANLEMNAAFRVGRHAVFAAPRGIFRLDEITGDPATDQAPGS